ncbi:hypothetical protein D0501_07445 [Leuconostoc holzapfelii]|uniref:Peptidase C39-like domain-containing protein n=1 Tax=Leuconostoc holzapfelii TaxID=434464 RepID=A0ABT2P0L1_9LACO|nr:C39 family peptidase [Leuconostoc holzapfelii]MCT8389901.1 hypothetical protein [Leuconostoc holzapfelii]
MIKKYKLYKSGKILVTGFFVAGLVALAGVSQANADTVTSNDATQTVQTQSANTNTQVDSQPVSNAATPTTDIVAAPVAQNTTNDTITSHAGVSASTSNSNGTVSTQNTSATINDTTSNSITIPTPTPTPTTSSQTLSDTQKKVSAPDITLQGQGQNYGWQNPVQQNQTAGTVGQSERLEAVKITVNNAASTYQGDVIYQTHLAGTGWQNEVKNGELSGTVGQSRQIEAIKVHLTGDLANQYDIYYRVHIQNFGWLDWTSNGGVAGSTGLALRVEAIQFMLNLKQQAFTQSTQRASVSAADMSFQVQGQDYGWQNTVANNAIGGTTGQSRRVEAIKIYNDNHGLTGDIVYQVHLANTGWQNAVSDGQLAGTVEQSRQMEAIKVNLTGDLANYYDIFYRVHIQDIGWLAWTADNGIAGSTGLAKRIEAIQLNLVRKGDAAPQTGLAYLDSSNYQVNTKHANQPVYFSQLDGRWANHRFNDYTMGPAGCVPTSIAMVLNGSYGITVSPDDVRNVMNTISTSSYGATGIDLINTVHYYGRQVEQINTVARTAQLLQQGVPVIFYVNVSNNIGHAIATYGYSNGATQVYDPYNRYYFNGWYDVNYLSNTLSRDPGDWNAGRPVFAIM